MNTASYFKLGLATLLPMILTVFFFFLEEKTPFRKWKYGWRQLLIGCMFGACAIFATEYGVPYENGVISIILNVRDAAPICAGLLFGAPAGCIAGILGGAERALEPLWGVGAYSVIACSVSTALAGCLAGLARKRMFGDRPPSPLFATVMAIGTEVVHMTVMLLTHVDDADRAMQVIKLATVPMIIANAASVLAASGLLAILRHETNENKGNAPYILETIEYRLLSAILVAFLLSNGVIYLLQTNSAKTAAKQLLQISVQDVRDNILETVDDNLFSVASEIVVALGTDENRSLADLAETYEITEISLVDSHGIIRQSTNPKYEGFDFHSGEQAAEFLVLLSGNVREYAQEFQVITYNQDGVTLEMKYVGMYFRGGFLQLGLDYDSYLHAIDTVVGSVGNNRHIGNSGYSFIALPSSHIVSGEQMTVSEKDASALVRAMLAEDEFESLGLHETAGEKMYTYYSVLEGYYIVGVLPYAEAMDSRDSMLYLTSFMEVLLFFSLFVLIFLIIRQKVVSKIANVNEKLEIITGGNLDVKVNAGGSREMVTLSDDINATVDTLKHYIEMTAKKIDDELLYAKRIQHSALPGVFPQRKECSLYASMDTAKDVGGDFYDFYMLDENRLAFLIADVSGKGIPAAMFMMTAKTLIRSIAETGAPVETVLTEANNRLCENNEAGMFVTAWMGVLNLQTGELRFANAGHNPPLWAHNDGTFRFLKTRPGLVLAGMDGARYRVETMQLSPGDKIFLYTDGVTEATSAEIKLYGEERLQTFLNAHKDRTPEETIHAVRDSIDEFVGDAEQFDDITMLMVHYGGNGMDTETHVYPAEIGQLDAASDAIAQMLERHDANMKAQMQIAVAFEEMFVNVCHYAYKGGKGDVTVQCTVSDGMAEITIIDTGVPFNPLGRDDPDITLSAEDRQIGGLGIFMVRKTMDEVLYRYENNQNILTIKKKI